MKSLLKKIYHFLPVQLFFLHFKKYQVLLLFWWILFITTGGNFLKSFGADGLLLAPEYLNSVNYASTYVTGMALAVFFMSWNITTFILHSKRLKFLATTSNPFMKYCINNSLLPLTFIVVYIIRMYNFNQEVELLPALQIWSLILGLVLGMTTVFLISFVYFFGAEQRIVRAIAPLIANPIKFREKFNESAKTASTDLNINYYITGRLKLKKPRPVNHYKDEFINVIFKRHHLAGMFSVFLAFVFLVIVGFFLENKYFEMPAVASFLIFFAIFTAVIGALVYFLTNWSLVFAILFIGLINFFYEKEIIDPRNKAYGLVYDEPKKRPAYNKVALQELSVPDSMLSDKQNMIQVLNKWKAKQTTDKPLIVFINVSGGGLRSAAFVMSTLQHLDSMTSGKLMNQTFLITGASGGMLAATYYRELYRMKLNGENISMHDPRFGENISKDLLNPVFTSMIARDLFSPVQKFKVDGEEYVKDRGYAFEKKLSDNTFGVLNFQIKDRAAEEREAKIPMMLYNSIIKSDGRKMMICSQPIRFMMKPADQFYDSLSSPDAVDFVRYFKDLSPDNLRALTALRMNATFPYVLPNVWLPTKPVIDVMDAGLRDNYGIESNFRFYYHLKDWIDKNTGGVLFLSIRDKPTDNWQNPVTTNSMTDMLINPFTMLQQNWYKLQDYSHADQYSFLFSGAEVPVYRVPMVYVPEKEDKVAAMNFHLSARERRDVEQSFYHIINRKSVADITHLLK